MRPGFDCEAVAGLLESGRTLSAMANGAAIVAGVGYWYQGPGASSFALALSMIFWLAGSWFAARVGIDRKLFRAMAEDPDGSAARLDTLLVDWKLVKAPKSRNMDGRFQGALRLLRLQWVALVLQLAALGGAMTLRAVNL